jgi:hypothetical protein
MKLFTKEIERKLEKADYESDEAICKIFNPYGAGTWVIFGQDKRDKDILYAVCDIGMNSIEYGGVRRSELEGLQPIPGLHLERDLHFRNAGKPLTFFLEQETLVGI